jgi:hypothetical protein
MNGTEVIHPVGLQYSLKGTPQHPTLTLDNGAIDQATHNELREQNNRYREDWVMKEHKHTFTTWLQDQNIPYGGNNEGTYHQEAGIWTITPDHYMADI